MPKSRRSKACEYNLAERQVIYQRDNERCVICGSAYGLSVAHMIPRSYGGLGIRQNGVLLCMGCHSMMDNGANRELRVAYQKFVRNYLESFYPTFTDEERVFKK